MEHMLIEKGADQLYAVYHEPLINSLNHIGVVLCYPYGQEYILCHKLYANMASRLATLGYHVLRFDYRGTGDSSAEFTFVTVEGSMEDIKVAVNKLIGICNVTKIVLGGARFGATLAVLYSHRYKVDALFLWNPIIDGPQYLDSINREYERWLRDSFAREEISETSGLHNFGFVFSSTLINEIRSISLQKNSISNSIPILLIDDKDQLQLKKQANISLYNAVNTDYWRRREDELEKSFAPDEELSITLEWLKNNLE